MATAKDAIKIARSLLNDDLATRWSDAHLFPKIQIAHLELQNELRLNSIPVLKVETIDLAVAANATILTAQPTDIIDPIHMKEKDVGASIDEYDDMIEVPFLPTINKGSTLIYWTWREQVIKFIGATVARQVLLRYTKQITTPTKVMDDLGVIGSELFLGTRAAFLVSKDLVHNNAADNALSTLIRTNVKGMQGVLHRRLPYRHRGRRRVG